MANSERTRSVTAPAAAVILLEGLERRGAIPLVRAWETSVALTNLLCGLRSRHFRITASQPGGKPPTTRDGFRGVSLRRLRALETGLSVSKAPIPVIIR